MFLKISRSRGHSYLQIVRSYREGKSVKHKVLANLGRFDVLAHNPQLISLGKRFLHLANINSVNVDAIEEKQRLCYGHIVYRRLWKRFKMPELLKYISRKKMVKFDFAESVYLMAIDRLLSPGSKRKTYQKQNRYAGLYGEVSLNHIYRSLDILAEGKEHLEDALFERHKDLFNSRVDVVFYDVTTFHFESVRADELRKFGFSKAGKFNEVQVVLGLLTDEHGRPIGFDLFPGDIYEGKTLIEALNKLKNRFHIRRVIIVGDKAMSNKANLWLIEKAGYEYIVSVRIKGAKLPLKEAILNPQGYHNLKDAFRYKVLSNYEQEVKDAKGRRRKIKTTIICTWSKERAEKDRADRERMLEKARAIPCGINLRDRRGYRRYLSTNGGAIVTGIDNAQFEADALWDGYYAIQTNSKRLNPQEILYAYHGLWKIEESFRVIKSTMEARPIFHWTPKRILGHFVLCFIAFLLERTLEQELRKKGIEASPEQIREALNSLEVSQLQIEDAEYYLKGRAEALANKILRAMRIAPLKNITPPEDFKIC